MIKYCFMVYDKESNEKITQVIVNVESALETLQFLNELGYVKGYVINDVTSEELK